ncbi:MAG: tetratricopeptide repeat protein [Phormidesmis sp.]
MSEAELFTELGNLGEVDPFALLGVSVSADDKRLTKRYRQIAKQLHPDALFSKTQISKTQISKTQIDQIQADHTQIREAQAQGLTSEIAAQVISKLINPAYQKLKHQKSRTETITLLRLRVRRLVRSERLIPTFPDAQQLESLEAAEIDVFYEQALSQLAAIQFRSLGDFHVRSLAIGQINLVYLQRKMADLVIRPKPTGLISSETSLTDTLISSKIPIQTTVNRGSVGHSSDSPASKGPSYDTASKISFVRQHTNRAKIYLSQKNYEKAVQELRDALKLSPQSPEIHSMIGQTYYKQNLSGMAKAHFRQALKLNPNHKVALKYGTLLGLTVEDTATKQPQPQTAPPSPSPQPDAADTLTASKAWLGRLLNR